LALEDIDALNPWYNGYKGTIDVIEQADTKAKGRKRQQNGNLCKKFACKGTYEWIDEEIHRENGTIGDTIHISEVPGGKWVNDYKQFLEEAMECKEDNKKGGSNSKSKSKQKVTKKKKSVAADDSMEIDDDGADEDYDPTMDSSKSRKSESKTNEKEQIHFKPGDILDVRCNHTDTTVSFTVKLADKIAKKFWNNPSKIEKMFKLKSVIDTGNMHCFNMKGNITRYRNEQEILLEFFKVRLSYYYKRKDILLEQLHSDFVKVDNKVRFILAVVNEEIVINNRKKSQLLEQLRHDNYTAFPPDSSTMDKEDENEDKDVVVLNEKDYDYLLSMPLWNLTMASIVNSRNPFHSIQPHPYPHFHPLCPLYYYLVERLCNYHDGVVLIIVIFYGY
jgi:DNA topoisomerase-2